ncbi:unnamed protein product [Adineta ricciae]|uniref:ATPase AAA-type core domain-containing protein n=1 Tax=Adineta ricciae TaxID=249248 RepID=A0A816E512_ADIRI|nr:unnamed protein product [Adineta ricciae]CAF1641505.1 unnamed protein product [Adineta ricciae]
MTSNSERITENYQGYINPKTVANHEQLLMEMSLHGTIQPARLFALKYRVLPCTMVSNSYSTQIADNTVLYTFHTTSVVKYLLDQYQIDPCSIVSNSQYIYERKISFYSDLYLDLNDYLSIFISGGNISVGEMDNPFGFQPDTDNVKETSLQMVCYNPQSGFYTSSISIKRPLIKDLRLNYGEQFTEGTGKTYYIRYLIHEITEKMLIYIPPDLVTEISKPGFLPFLMQYPNSILIIEDSENIILDRKESVNPNQAVSNLLNLSDGLLGDAMHQQIIATFNCEIKNIDPALCREGRLLVEHKFDKLSVENSRRLAKELGVEEADQIQVPMTLAEIYAKKISFAILAPKKSDNTSSTMLWSTSTFTTILTSTSTLTTTLTKKPGWSIAGDMSAVRYQHTVSLLENGKVLVVGGIQNSSILDITELYDPVTQRWITTGVMNDMRHAHIAVVLRNGKVLVAGGFNGSDFLNTAELYDPLTGIWTMTGSMNNSRNYAAGSILPNGKVLVSGGYDGDNILDTAEIYDPSTEAWTITGNMNK